MRIKREICEIPAFSMVKKISPRAAMQVLQQLLANKKETCKKP